MSKRLIFWGLPWALSVSLVGAQTLPKTGQLYQSVNFDLGGDGQVEKIALAAYNAHPESDSFWGRLKVFTSDGKLLWQGPRVTQASQHFAFGSWPYGLSELSWVGDLEGDGVAEILSTEPVSDVRPPVFRKYQWKNQAFHLKGRYHLLEESSGSGLFSWTAPKEWSGTDEATWIASLSGAPDQIVAEVVSVKSGGETSSVKAVLKNTAAGLMVKKWLK